MTKTDEYLRETGLDWNAEEWYEKLWEIVDWKIYAPTFKLGKKEQDQIFREIFMHNAFLNIVDKDSLINSLGLSEDDCELSNALLKEIDLTIQKGSGGKYEMDRVTEYEFDFPEDSESLDFFSKKDKEFDIKRKFGVIEPGKYWKEIVFQAVDKTVAKVNEKGLAEKIRSEVIRLIITDRLLASKEELEELDQADIARGV